MIKKILSVVVGIVVAVIVFVIVEQLVHLVYPFPAGLDFQNVEQVNQYLANVPFSYWILVLLGWIVGSVLAGILIKRISRSDELVLPLIAGAVLTLSGLANVFSFQHHAWFVVTTLMVFFVAVFTGHRLVGIKS
jgi:hypothetical protein